MAASLSLSTLPVAAASTASTEGPKRIKASRVSKAQCAQLDILPRRVATRLRRSYSDKSLSDRAVIMMASAIQTVFDRLILESGSKTAQEGRVRVRAQHVAQAIQESSDFSTLFPGVIPGASRVVSSAAGLLKKKKKRSPTASSGSSTEAPVGAAPASAAVQASAAIVLA